VDLPTLGKPTMPHLRLMAWTGFLRPRRPPRRTSRARAAVGWSRHF